MKPVVALPQKTEQSAIKAQNLGKVYPNGTRALSDVSISIEQDEFAVVIGLSGAGKSTLLRCLNRLIRPTEGRLFLFNQDITNVSGQKLRNVRCRVGMIFQQFHLVRRLTALENVLVGRLRFNSRLVRHKMSLLRLFSKQEREAAFDCLKQVGIAELAFQRADTLSGGQQQRVAIARALAQNPEVFLADEPVASLDPRSSEIVMDTLRRIQQTRRIPVVVNLHQVDFAQRYATRILGMARGRVVFEGGPSDLCQEAIEMVYGKEAKEVLCELSFAS
ncbi:MAG: phosphonate ABC transporter ATP-binding protein [Desulfarculaceae bacterium]|jgi:phosphonate transport system ATP-binding protein